MSALLRYCRMPRSTFYYCLRQMKKQDKYAQIKQDIQQIYHENHGRYGYRRITLELHNRGYHINHKTVQKLMNSLNLKSLVRKRRYRSYRGEVGKIAPNILNREFKTDKPNQKWVTDVTEFRVGDQKLYLSPIMDLYNGEIISYTIATTPNYSQIEDMLDKAFARISDNTKLILHSDQGWHYQTPKYVRTLKEKGIIQSMSRKGNCLDNAMIENFFGILKSEMYYGHKFESIETLKKELEEYIEYYNNKRIKSKLNGLSPVQYRIQSTSVA